MEKTFTQEEVNSIVRERLLQEKTKNEKLLSDKEAEYKVKLEQAESGGNKVKAGYLDKLKNTCLLAELKVQGAVNPSEIAKILSNSIKVNDVGDVSFTDDKGKETGLSDGVKAYLDNNHWAKTQSGLKGVKAGEDNHDSHSDNDLRKAMGLPV